MKAVLLPARDDAAPRVVDVDEPRRRDGDVLARTLLTGVDGTDEEIVRGEYGEPPPGRDALVLGHECLAEVVEAPEGSGLAPGDRVVPLVRHGCGRCRWCVSGRADHCVTGDYTEHGIKGLDGFMRERWTDAPDAMVRAPEDLGDLAVLAEPLSVVAKAFEEAAWFQRRLPAVDPMGRRALVAGAGSLGMLAAFLLRSEGFEVWAMDRSPHEAAPARLLRDVGARHVNAREEDVREIADEVGGFDLVLEATGVPSVAFDVVQTLEDDGVMGMLGVPAARPPERIEASAIMKGLVLGNRVLFGSVNSAPVHFAEAFERLRSFRERWPSATGRILSHRYAPDEAPKALRDDPPDLVKKVVDWR